LDVAFKNVPASIRLARASGAHEVWLLTSSVVESVAGVDRVFSRIPQAETAAVYRSCDVCLKLSLVEGMFGPPLEQFHCGGTAIVYDVTGHAEYIEHGRNALVARMGDEDEVLRHLRRLREVPDFLDGLKAGAARTAAAWPDWAASGRQFETAVDSLMVGPAGDREALRTYSRRIWKMVEHHWMEMAERAQTPTLPQSPSDTLTRVIAIGRRAIRDPAYGGRLVGAVVTRVHAAVDRRLR
jgi:hypothetical protein